MGKAFFREANIVTSKASYVNPSPSHRLTLAKV